jgi:DNA-binding NarL/FixJ family response regulator
MPDFYKGSTIRVVLADDHSLVRSGIKALLSTFEGLEVIAEAADGGELIKVVESLRPDLVLTDIAMPHMDGLAAIEHIHHNHPEVSVVVLSMYCAPDIVKRAVASGACGYLMKNAAPSELEQAIRSVMAKGGAFSPAIAQLLLQPVEHRLDDKLSARQIQILRLMVQGRAAKEIGHELGISDKTVHVHRNRIMHNLGIHDVPGLTRYAIRMGIIKA